jgi:hypothetical protein
MRSSDVKICKRSEGRRLAAAAARCQTQVAPDRALSLFPELRSLAIMPTLLAAMPALLAAMPALLAAMLTNRVSMHDSD